MYIDDLADKYWGEDPECVYCPYNDNCDRETCRKEDYRQAKIEDMIDKAMEGLD